MNFIRGAMKKHRIQLNVFIKYHLGNEGGDKPYEGDALSLMTPFLSAERLMREGEIESRAGQCLKSML